MPGHRLVFRNENVGVTVAVEIHEPKIRVASIAIQPRGERAEWFPTSITIMFVEARCRTIQHDEIELTVARQVHELRCSAGNRRVWPCANELYRSKFRSGALNAVRVLLKIDWRNISFVEPAI